MASYYEKVCVLFWCHVTLSVHTTPCSTIYIFRNIWIRTSWSARRVANKIIKYFINWLLVSLPLLNYHRKCYYYLLLSKPAAQAEVGKTDCYLIIVFATPQAPASLKTEKHNSESNCTLTPIKRSGAKHSERSYHIRILAGRKHLSNFDDLHRWYFELQWMGDSRSSSMSKSGWCRWKLTEQTMIWVPINLEQHTQSSNMTFMTWWQETLNALPPNTPGAPVADDDNLLLTPTTDNNTQGLGEP